ncbi:unnamed protein product [Caenorhabditis sp. 36 PRJEB53466]|nr:unnamed protein product [Caenorhabditis sp. 36 PRJEB53466]
MSNMVFNTVTFHQILQPNGEYFTVPRRYENIQPFLADKPFVAMAYDMATRRPVVIKKVVLPDNFNDRQNWKRAQRELYCMLLIEHENIVRMHSVFTPAENINDMTEFYIVREYMSGNMKMLTNHGQHSTIKSIFFDICRAVQYFHNVNISYRDLKPQNILIQDSEVRICDFGHANTEDPNMNTPYIVQRYYRAPEIICETCDNNKTSVDIWSLGCLFAELLTNHVLFQGDDHIDQFLKIVRYMGNPAPVFYQTIGNQYAKHFLQHIRLDEIPEPRPIRERFPDSWFQPGLQTDPRQCELARDLLFKMLVVNPDFRVNIQEILTHPYLADVWQDEGMEIGDLEPPPAPAFLRRFFGALPYSDSVQMQAEIFLRIKEFENSCDICTQSKN